jgi:hypothetical protein
VRQNQPDMIRYLAAQRQLYDEEKRCKVGVYVLMAVSSLSIMAVVGLGFWPVTDPQIALLAFILAIMELGILHVIGHKRDDAARIQELFDCELLQLEWNDILVDRPDSLLIQGAVDRFNKKPNHREAEAKLRDWYSRDFAPDTSLVQARLSCQKSNLYWDKDIRNEWKTVLIISLALVVVLTLILSEFLHWTIIDYFKGPFLLIVPLVVIVFKEILDQGLAYKRIDELERKADYLLQEIKHTDIDEADIIEKSRQLQDEIYNHRKMDSTIPNFIYDRVRKRREPSRAKPVPAEK